MEEKKVNHIFESFARMRVLVIGDVMIDSYLWGKVDRVSPEAPIPVVSVTKRENRLGGAANVALNLLSLGATPLLFSVIGQDEGGNNFNNLLTKRGLSSEGIFTDPKRITTVKNRVISKGQHLARVDEETTEPISGNLEKSLITRISDVINNQQVDAIIYVDYDKGVITPHLFQALNEISLQHKIPTAVDPKFRNFSLYQDITLFKPNFKEFEKGVKKIIPNGDFKELKKNAEWYRKKQSLEIIFITLSELGVYISNGKKEKHFPAEIRDISDVSGAGDTVISVAGLGVAIGLKVEEIAFISNIAGGLVCEKPGVVPVNKEQLKNIMKTQKI